MRTTPTLFVASACAALAAFGFTATASAQGATGAPAAQPAPADPHQLPPVAADAKPVAPTPAANPDDKYDDDTDDSHDYANRKNRHRAKKEEEEEHDHVRFRGGVSGYGGAYIIGGFAIPYGGVEGRLGVQIKDWVAVYAVPAFLLGAEIGQNSAGVVGRISLGVIPEFTVADLWFIGLGPEAYLAAGGGTRSNADGTSTKVFAGGSVVGINGRTGFAFGSVRPGRRKMFTIAFDGRLDFFAGHPAFAPALSLGYDAM